MSEVEKKYRRTILFQTEAFEVVSIEWSEQSVSALHGHGWSQCHVLIEEGVFENRLDLGIKQEVRMLEPGQVVSTPVGARHELVCKSPKGKTLHIYTPKIVELTENGKFQPAPIQDLKSAIDLSESVDIANLEKLLSRFQNESISTHSPYFMNQLFTGVLPQMLMAEELIVRTKTTLATYEASSIFSAMEAEVIEALGKQIGWSSGIRSGVSVPGGSAANFMAVHCARHRAIPEVKTKGMYGARLKVFVSEEAHYSFKKALAILGVGIENLVQIPVDQAGRMVAKILRDRIQECRAAGDVPLMVAATAGTTVLGAFDELPKISKICQEFGVWLHVDGAWGGPAIFSTQLRHLVEGIASADSVTFDAHKLFGANLTSSFFLTRHKEILLNANDVSGAEYLFHSDDPTLDRGRLSWQCGRKADAASFWTLWKSVGTEGLGKFVDRLIGLREETRSWIQDQPRLELIAEPDYLNICIRVHPPGGGKDPDWSRKVRENLKTTDLAMVNYSSNLEGTFLRLILAHPYLEFCHIRQILEWSLEQGV